MTEPGHDQTSTVRGSSTGWPAEFSDAVGTSYGGTKATSSPTGWVDAGRIDSSDGVDQATNEDSAAEVSLSAPLGTSGDAAVSRETGSGQSDEFSLDALDLVHSPIAAALAKTTRRRDVVEAVEVRRPAQPRILTVANQKGGVGKTTSAVNVAAALAQSGLRVLVIDIDPQGNASTALGVPHHRDVPGTYEVLVDGLSLAEVLQSCPDVAGLWCVPASIDLAGAEIELVTMQARDRRLRVALEEYFRNCDPAEVFDYVLIDCPPSLGLLTVNAFVAADEVFIPIQSEYYALEGLSQLVHNVELIKENLNPTLELSTILLTMYDARTRLSAQVADEVRAHFPDQVLKVKIPRSVRISEAPSHGQTVMTYEPSSTGALSYLEAAKELAGRAAGYRSAHE